MKGPDCIILRRRHTTDCAKRQRDQGMPENEALHFRQREYPHDPSSALRQQVMRPVPEASLQHAFPPDAVEESGLGALFDELLPTRSIIWLERAHPERSTGLTRVDACVHSRIHHPHRPARRARHREALVRSMVAMVKA